MDKLDLYIDGKKIPKKNIDSIWTNKNGVLMVKTIDKKSKEIVQTDGAIRKIELK